MNDLWIGVVGWPLKQSFSKKIHEENIRNHELDWKFKVLEWAPQYFEKNIRQLKADQTCQGISVTMPYKAKIISYLDECEEFAKQVQSVNCVKVKGGRWIGYNTDAPGFLYHFNQWNPLPPKETTVVILGTGATGRALSFSLAQKGYQNFILINRTFEKAQEWGEKFKGYFPEIKVQIEQWGDPSRFALQDDSRMTHLFILNTTPLGMNGESLKWLDIAQIQSPAWIFDVTYNPPETSLLRQCKSRCFYTMNGWPMFQKQAELAFQLWIS